MKDVIDQLRLIAKRDRESAKFRAGIYKECTDSANEHKMAEERLLKSAAQFDNAADVLENLKREEPKQSDLCPTTYGSFGNCGIGTLGCPVADQISKDQAPINHLEITYGKSTI